MKNWFAILTLLAIAIPASAGTVSSKDLTVQFRGTEISGGRLSAGGNMGLSIQGGGVFVLEEKSAKQVPLSTVKAGASSFLASGGGLQLAGEYTGAPGAITLRLLVENPGKTRRLLEPGITLNIKTGGKWTFWDGYAEQAGVKGADFSRSVLDGTFPAATLYTKQGGLAMGIDPMQLYSWVSGAASSPNGSDVSFRYSVRMVLDPGQKKQVDFILLGYASQYGYLHLLQRYADIFPPAYQPDSNLDQRIYKTGAMYAAVNSNSPEVCRRSHSGWEWVYAPFKRSGDAYGHEEYWNYTPIKEWRKHPYMPFGAPIADFHAARRSMFANNGRNTDTMMLFYLCPNYMEYKLAEDVFDNARVKNEPGSREVYENGWVTGHDKEFRVMPHGSEKLMEFYKKNMTLVTGELDLSGFCWDLAVGAKRLHEQYYKPAALEPGRGWDDQGIFIAEGVPYAGLLDHARSMKSSGGRLANVCNLSGAGTYLIASRADNCICEGNLWENRSGYYPENMRRLMGSKPMTWWGTWKRCMDSVNTAGLSAAEKKEVYEGLINYGILLSLRYGMLPGQQISLVRLPDDRSNSKIVKHLPLFEELCSKAFIQPLPAVNATGKDIWTSRYGRDAGSFITASDASFNAWKGTISTDNKYFGDASAYIFADYYGARTANTCTSGQTELSLSLEPHAFFVGRTLLALKSAPSSNPEVYARRTNSLSVITDRIEFKGGTNTGAYARIPEGCKVASVTLSGSAIPFSVEGKDVQLTLKAAPGSVLEITYKSGAYTCTKEQLFSFFKSNTAFAVVSGDMDGERYSAFRLQNYFANARKYGSYNQAVPQVLVRKPDGTWKSVTWTSDYYKPVEKAADAPAQSVPAVMLAVGGRAAQVEITENGRVLTISAPDAASLERLTLETLNLLDEAFPYDMQ